MNRPTGGSPWKRRLVPEVATTGYVPRGTILYMPSEVPGEVYQIMNPEETTKRLQRLERMTRFLYWSGASIIQEPHTPRRPVLRSVLMALIGLYFILVFGDPLLKYLENTEESATDLIGGLMIVYIGIASISICLTQTRKSRHRHPKSFRSINTELMDLLSEVRLEHLDLLCRILLNGNGVLWDGVRVKLEGAVVSFLLGGGVEDAPLSSGSIRWLKYQALVGKDTTLRVAALFTIKDRDVDGLQEVALSASRSGNDRVRAAARDVLTTMRGTR